MVLEQYKTSASLAAQMLFLIDSDYDDIDGKIVADFGCGTGILSIGSQILGAACVRRLCPRYPPLLSPRPLRSVFQAHTVV